MSFSYIQGDIVGLTTTSGLLRVAYTYDAWGKPLTTTGSMAGTLGKVNPLRYRGYVYDEETGLYYLGSRYYDPGVGRWINSDTQMNMSLTILGANIFAYCLNNPTNKVDYCGNKPGDLFDTIDEAAIDFGNYINAKSIDEGIEYASYIYTKAVTVEKVSFKIIPFGRGYNSFSLLWDVFMREGICIIITKKITTIKYTYRDPKAGKKNSVSEPINWFGIHNKVGLLHTHGASYGGSSGDYFSITDTEYADKLGVPIYVATPLGTLRKYENCTTSLIRVAAA